jgi:hypothetical protein
VNDLLLKLLAVLEAEHALYERLCEALRAERAALSSCDVPALERLVREKEEISDEGRLLEESRIAVTEAFARQLGIAEARPKLSRLCELLGEASPRLRAAHQRLATLLALARELLEANSAVTVAELANVQSSLRALGATLAGETYGRGAPAQAAGRIARITA